MYFIIKPNEMDVKFVEFRDHIFLMKTDIKCCKIFMKSCDKSTKDQQARLNLETEVILLKTDYINGSCLGIVEKDQCKSLFAAVEFKSSLPNILSEIKIFHLDSFNLQNKLNISIMSTIQLKTPIFTDPVFFGGPSLYWETNDSLNLYDCNENCVRTAKIEQSIKSITTHILEYKLLKSEQCSHTGVLIIKKIEGPRRVFISSYTAIIDSKETDFKNVYQVDNRVFMPSEYESIVTALKIELNPNQMRKHPLNCCSTSDDKFLTLNWTCIATTEKEFIVFINGLVRYCCTIPKSDIRTIVQVKEYSPYRCTFLLKSEQGICAIQKNQEIGVLELKEEWKNGCEALAGNFLDLKNEQILIAFKTKPDEFRFVFWEKFNFLKENKAEANIHMKKIEESLNKKINIGQTHLNSINNEMRDKLSVLETAFQTIKVQNSGLDPRLTPAATKENGNSTITVPPPPALCIVTHWTTVWSQYWIIGFTLQNTSKELINELHGNICIKTSETLNFVQKVFFHPVSEIPTQPTLHSKSNEQMHLQPMQMASLVLAVKLTTFSNTFTEAGISICWKLKDNPKNPQQLTYKCQLGIEDIMLNNVDKMKSLTSIQRLMSLRVFQSKVTLSVTSQQNPVDLFTEILSREKHSSLESIDYLNYKWFIFNDPTMPLYGTNFEIEVKERYNGEINVFCRTNQELLLLFHWFYKILPGDFHLQEMVGKTPSDKLIACLKEELALIESMFKNRSTTKPDSNSITDVSESLSQELKEAELKLPYNFYHDFRHKLAQLEIKTDLIVSNWPPN